MKNQEILEKYQISPELSREEQLSLLEKAKQKLLRKLNHVFGDPEKEQELDAEMELLEQTMDQLRSDGGVLSLDDVALETRGLSQTVVEPGMRKELKIQEKERRYRDSETTYVEKISYATDILIYYLSNRMYDKYSYWCLEAAKLGLPYFMNLAYQYYTKPMFGAEDPDKAYYWLKKAAEAGDADCCMELGKRYLVKDSPLYSLQNAVVCFVRAADEEHPDAYLMAFSVFQAMGQYEKAETCLKTAYDMGIQGAAYRLALIYDVDANKTGERQIDEARKWYERAYAHEADGDICFGLGRIYMEIGKMEEGINLLIQGHQEFQSEDCLEELQELYEESC